MIYARRRAGGFDPHAQPDQSAPNDYSGPWALESIGGAGGQTVVGAFSTGTHGGDVACGPIADAVIRRATRRK